MRKCWSRVVRIAKCTSGLPANRNFAFTEPRSIFASTGCNCDLSRLLVGRLEGAPFNVLAWVAATCPSERGFCFARRAVLRSVFSD